MGRVKTEKADRPRRAGAGLALIACVLLAGCAGQLAGDVGPKTEDRAVKTTPAKVQIPDPDHFTTKGKPTKTIQTPNGPVEIYDPTQDPEVRAAFERIYTQNNSNYLYGGGGPLNRQMGGIDIDQIPETIRADVEVLYKALEGRRQQYLSLSCHIVSESDCGQWWQMTTVCPKKITDHTCLPRYTLASANSRVMCDVDGKTVYRRSWHPIGTAFIDKSLGVDDYDIKPENPNADKQFRNFYAATCSLWNPVNQPPKP